MSQPDYKALYEAEKKEKEQILKLYDELVNQLDKAPLMAFMDMCNKMQNTAKKYRRINPEELEKIG